MLARLTLAAVIAAYSGLALASQVPLTDVAQLSARSGHACVVTTGGGAKCWGSNYYGQLGAGPGGQYDYRKAATDVVGLTSGVLEIAVSTGAHTCAIVTGGGIKCWGLNDKGQLGDGTTTSRLTPVDVVGLPWPAVGLTAANGHTCAFSADGAVACWGGNSRGQLGDGTTTQRLTPAVVPGLSGVVEMSAAVAHTCALTAAGAMKCWGANYNGALGDGTRTDQPSPVDVSGLATGVTAIATGGAPSPSFVFGDYSTTCATAAGVMKCWGGSTMTGSFYGDAAPVDVTGAPTGLAQMTTGGFWFHTLGPSGYWVTPHTCVVTSTGGARCWGANFCGLLGDGLEPDCTWNYGGVSPPGVEVAGLSSGVVSVSASASNTCALQSDGVVKCWGSGYGVTPIAAVEGTNPQAISWSFSASFVAVGSTGQFNAATGGGSGNPIVYTSLTPQTCSVSGTTVTGIAGGTCTIAADQAGSAYYDPAPQVTGSFAIDPRQMPVITFDQVPTLVVNGFGSVVATSSSGRPVVISAFGACGYTDYVLKGFSVGTCNVHASQPGDEAFAPATADVQISVSANTGTLGIVVYKWGGGTGSITSSPAAIDCGVACTGNFATGSAVTLTAAASSGSIFDGWGGACSGTGPCVVSMDAAKTVTARFDSELVRLSNLSTRAQVLPGGDVLIGGFVIGGTANKTVLLRARGWSIQPYVTEYAVANPFMQLYRVSDQAMIASNDDWQTAPTAGVMRALGLNPAIFGDEAGILITLAPGAYTAQISPRTGTGLGIFEIFELDRADQPLINISTRGRVGTGESVMVAGFIIEGSGSQTVVVRGMGPSLAAYGVTGTIADPSLRLVRMSDGATLAVNDNWREAANASAVTASGFAPSNDLESAILVTLEPGAYTAILSGTGGTTGNGIVEVYKAGN